MVKNETTPYFVYGAYSAPTEMKKHGFNRDDFVIVHEFEKSYTYFAFNKEVTDKEIKKIQQALDEVKKKKAFMKQLKEKYLD